MEVSQEDLVEEPPQGRNEEQKLSTLKACEAAYGHDKYSGNVLQLADEASHESPGVKLHQAWAEEQSLSTLKAHGAVCEHDCFLESISSSDVEENSGTPSPVLPLQSLIQIPEDLDLDSIPDPRGDGAPTAPGASSGPDQLVYPPCPSDLEHQLSRAILPLE
ncbi:hypothetical protein MJT46_010553 [Ovis ammon polii x Ovis aries]|nr:hypothetical protein MJT46_010553 [Ovis ammon polii x Ovis aries]